MTLADATNTPPSGANSPLIGPSPHTDRPQFGIPHRLLCIYRDAPALRNEAGKSARTLRYKGVRSCTHPAPVRTWLCCSSRCKTYLSGHTAVCNCLSMTSSVKATAPEAVTHATGHSPRALQHSSPGLRLMFSCRARALRCCTTRGANSVGHRLRVARRTTTTVAWLGACQISVLDGPASFRASAQ